MKVKEFLKLVEIQTKVASVLPLFIGFLYSRLTFGSFQGFPSLLFFLSLLCLDMGTTALNHYSDFEKDQIGHGYGYEEHNPMSANQLHKTTARRTILLLFFFSFVFGILLVWQTDYVVLLLGLFSAAMAFLCSKGPVPISYTPFGELFSGTLMGGVIFFIAVYIQNTKKGWIVYEGAGRLSLQLDVLLQLLFVSLPLVLGIANIMLANNICDREEDVLNGRHTLVSYLGQKRAVVLFAMLQALALVILLLLMVVGLFPWQGVVVFFALPLFYKNTKVFMENPSKAKTFVSSVKNFVTMALLMVIALIGALLW